MDSWLEQLVQICALQGFHVADRGAYWLIGRGAIVIAAMEPESEEERVTLVRTLIGMGLIFPADN